MKRVRDEDGSFKVKPYISKRKSNIDSTANDTYVASSTSVPSLKAFSNLKCQIPRREVDKRKEHSNVVTSIQWNERRSSCFVTSSLDKSLLLWNISYCKLSCLEKIVLHEEGVKDVKWTKDGLSLITASFDKTSKIVDAEKGVSLLSFKHDDFVTRVCCHPTDCNIFVTGTAKSGVFAWDARQKKVIKRYRSFFGQVQDILFYPDGNTFITSAEILKRNSMDQTVMAWDFDTTAVLSNQIYQEPYACTSLKFHPNHKSFLAQSQAGYIVIFDASSPWKLNKYKRYEGHKSAGYQIGFDISSDGSIIYSGDNDGQLFIYDGHSSQVVKKVQQFTSPLTNVACCPTHKSRISLSSWNGEVSIWE